MFGQNFLIGNDSKKPSWFSAVKPPVFWKVMLQKTLPGLPEKTILYIKKPEVNQTPGKLSTSKQKKLKLLF